MKSEGKKFFLEYPPKRIFLDTSVLQTALQFNCFSDEGSNLDVLDSETLERIEKIPNFVSNLDALNNIGKISLRNSFEYVISENSLKEISDKNDPDFSMWGQEFIGYCLTMISEYEEVDYCTGTGQKIIQSLDEKKFGYLGEKDKKLILDAVMHECEIFLTMENRLSKNSDIIFENLNLKILRPFEYWEHMKRWSALYY